MNTLKLAYRKLFHRNEQTTARIISLSVGLAFGIILLAEVFYYYSFDSFYPDAENIYVVHQNYKRDKSKKELTSRSRVSGAIGPGMQTEVPGVRVATRLNYFANSVFYTKDKKSYKAKFSLADEHWQDVIPRPMISGNAQEILTQPMQCIISDELAKKMGGNVVGKNIELKDYPGKKLIIGGVFEAVPENTLYEYDVLVSMISTKEFFAWDGTQNWLGNDRYYTCVKLEKGIKPNDLKPAVRKMQEKHQDIIEIEQKQPGTVFTYTFKPIQEVYPDMVKDMILILSIIAFAVLFVSLMNYMLLTISSLVNRAKSSAIYKCYGAQAKNLQLIILMETTLIFAISLVLAMLLIYFISPILESQVGHKVSSMFTPYVILPITGLMLIILLSISYLPGRFFARIPVATAFRTYRQKGNKWKLALLSVQFLGAAFILTTLSIVVLQYQKMLGADHGYNTENVYYTYANGMDGKKVQVVLNELKGMPEIENVGMGYGIPLNGASGNNVLSPDGEKDLFNVADFYNVDENYMKILAIPIIHGEGFSRETNTGDIVISRKGEEKLMLYNGWKDGIIGKSISITEHNDNGKTATIRGVYEDFIIGNMAEPDSRPSVFFFRPQEKFEQLLAEYPEYSCVFLIKTQAGKTHNIMKKITDIMNIAMPYNDAVVKSLRERQRLVYQPQKGFRNGIFIGSLVILLITLMGLIGYTNSEVNRRQKDLAIRKINGATLKNILKLFLWDLERVAIPAVIIGLGLAWIIAEKWMQNFAAKITLSWMLFALCSLVILGLVALVAFICYRRIGNQNPVKSLRYE